MPSSPVVLGSEEEFNSLLRTSRIVVVNFYVEANEACEAVDPVFHAFAQNFSSPQKISFIKIQSDKNPNLTQRFDINGFPTFIVLQNGEVVKKIVRASINEVKQLIEIFKSESASGSTSSSTMQDDFEGVDEWRGAELPRGYKDITDQIEIKNSELLNADEDAGTVRVLFERSKPSALTKGKGSSKDWVRSGADDQLLLFIPFQATVKLHTLLITSIPPEDQTSISRPRDVHLFINRPQNMDFDEAEGADPIQSITLNSNDWNADGTASIALRFVKFSKTTTLTIFVQKGENDAESVRIDRLRLIGEAGAMREMGKLQKVGDDE